MAVPEVESSAVSIPSGASATGTEPPSVFPSSLPVKDLLICHPDCHEGLIVPYTDAYEGGHKFEKRKSDYLRTRQLDLIPGSGAKYRAARMAAAYYTPHVAGIIDDLIGQLLYSPPRFEIEGEDARADYWRSLSSNADGQGNNLVSVVWKVQLSLALHKRAYLQIFDSRPEVTGANLKEQKNAGGADYRIKSIDAQCVTDFDINDNGEPNWIRTYHITSKRSSVAGPLDTEVHTWRYYTPNAIYVYEARKPANEKTFKNDATATLIDVESNALGMCSIIPLEVPDGFWIMDRLYGNAISLFNRESGREFCLDMGALNLPYYSGDNPPDNILMSEAGCLNLGPGGTFGFASPEGTVYQALESACKYLQNNLYQAIKGMALLAASQTENARQSADAKVEDRAPMKALLSLFGAPVQDALIKFQMAVQGVRQETDLKAKLRGLDEFDTHGLETLLGTCEKYISLVDDVPEAKREAQKKATSGMFSESPATVAALNAKIDAVIEPPIGGGDLVGKIPLALQQLALARQRYVETNDDPRAAKIAKAMDGLVDNLSE